jgi:flagellar L-ring protein precursor FlgH
MEEKMRKSILISAVITSFALAQSSWINTSEVVRRSLFSDHKAFKVGDIVTIIIIEVSSAENDARTSSSRSGAISGSVSGTGLLKFVPETGASVGTSNEFRGEGSTSNRGSVKAKISARIIAIDTTGNLLIEGTRRIKVNDGEQVIRIRGYVRPSDVNWDNTVFSFNIADAEIELSGKGMIYRVQGPSWVTKLLHWLF